MINKQLNRRHFLKLASVGTCGAACHNVLTPLNSMMAFADTPATLNTGKVLVVVNLAGGVSLNIAPLYHGAYRDKNPTISFGPENSLVATNAQGFHPSLTAYKAAWDQGRCAIINSVGYPNPNRSHEESTLIWQSGVRTTSAASSGGWGARLACVMNDSIFNGVSLAGANAFIAGGCNQPRAFGDLQNFGEDGFWGGQEGTTWMRNKREEVIALATTKIAPNPVYVTEQMLSLQTSIDLVRSQTQGALPVQFPNTGFGRSCLNAAKLINAPALKCRLIYLEMGGFDTHSDERNQLTQRLNELNGGLAAFSECMQQLGRWQDVTVITMSEFGRTFENASRGTDHGHANAMFVMGGSVAGGVKNPPPTDAETNAANGYYDSYAVDFREPFKAAVAHMGFDANGVFPEAFNIKNLSIFG